MSVVMTLLRSAAGDSITQKWVEHNKKFSEYLNKLKEEGLVLEWKTTMLVQKQPVIGYIR